MKHPILILLLALITSPASARNILLFTIDSCRADRLSCYGYPLSTTPHIDAWAKTGIIFEKAYSTTAWTAPGILSILSGLDPPTHQVNNRDHMGSPGLLTLPKVFKTRGYQVPNLNFFTFAPYYQHVGLSTIQRQYFGSQPGDELVNWLKERVGVDQAPFFVWYHTTILHQPYNPPLADLPAPKQVLLKSPGLNAVMTGAIVPQGSTWFSPEDRPLLNRLYEAELRLVDSLFGKTLKILSEKNILKDTLVILSADHGEELLDHGFIGHASTSLEARLCEEHIRIPLILSWPDKIPALNRVSHPVNQTDLFPTILRLFEIEIPGYIQGRDLLTGSARGPLFFESVIGGNQTTQEREHLWIRAVRMGKYKYISTRELYHLGRDPLERRNIFHKKRGTALRLQQALDNWLSECSLLHDEIFPNRSQTFSAAKTGRCPLIITPGNRQKLNYDIYTGMVLFDWTGSKDITYLIEYDIATGNHHVAGTYEIEGNHQLLGPMTRELWENLKAWNPFKFRVSPKTEVPCWSNWVIFRF